MFKDDRIPVTLRLLRGCSHVIQVDSCFELELGMRDPTNSSVRDHDVRPARASSIRASPFSNVLAPPDRKDSFVLIQVATNGNVAGIEKFPEARHIASLAPPACPNVTTLDTSSWIAPR